MNKDIMIDIETLGTTPDAVIASLAAARFDIETGKIEDSFYQAINWRNQPDRAIDPNTVKWWFRQDDEARFKLLDDGVRLPVVLDLLRLFIEKSGLLKDEIIWVNGPEFDVSILTHAYQNDQITIDNYDGDPPWNFWNTRDCRTMRAIAKGILDYKHFERGQKHNALDDVKYQIRYVSAIWKKLRG